MTIWKIGDMKIGDRPHFSSFPFEATQQVTNHHV